MHATKIVTYKFLEVHHCMHICVLDCVCVCAYCVGVYIY